MGCEWCKQEVLDIEFYECQCDDKIIVICDKCWENFFIWLLQQLQERDEIQSVLN